MNKKGFSLIELLAVIIVLIIITFISTMVITKIAGEARKEAAKTSFNAYIKAVDTYLVICQMNKDECEIDDGYRYYVSPNSNYVDYQIPNLGLSDLLIPKVYAEETINDNTDVYLNNIIKISGSYPTDGYFNIDDNKIEEAVCNFGGYRIIYNGQKMYVEGETNEILVSDVSFDQTTYNIVKDATLQMNPTITPSNATNKNLIYISDDESIAKVDDKGLVTGVGNGTTNITVKTGSITKKLEIIVGQIYVDGDTIYKDTLYDAVSSYYLVSSGTYTLHLANDEEILAEIYVIKEDTNYTTTPTLCDNVVDTKMCIYKYNGNLTVDASVTLTPQVRKKGFLVYVEKKLINNGNISMTARGASAAGQNVLLYKNSDNTYEYIPAVGSGGGTAVALSNADSISIAGKSGVDGSNRSTGGGGSGGVFNNVSGYSGSGPGGAGTSYSGGAGGGATTSRGVTYYGNAGSNTGGAGGAGKSNTYSNTGGYAAGGGAGNPGGAGVGSSCCTHSPGGTGTGGLLMIYTGTFENNGTISSNGSQGGYGTGASGGSSGGGSINVFANTISSYGNIVASGGITQTYGAPGGQGTINVGQLYNNNYYNYVFGYSGDYQKFSAPVSGNYKIELWGAQGGFSRYLTNNSGGLVGGGLGAYTSGTTYLIAGQSLYVYVGGAGKDGATNYRLTSFNGGSAGGTSYQGGSSGGGATDVRLAPETKKYRYVRDYLTGSSVNNGNHWVELQVFDTKGNLISANKEVTSNCAGMTSFAALTDGVTTSSAYIYSSACNGIETYVEIDLGAEYEIGDVKVWHYYTDNRVYITKLQLLNNDKTNNLEMFNSVKDGAYPELSVGRTYTLDGTMDFDSIKTRIMVAGGGAGSSNWTNARTGGYGGALIGGPGLLNTGAVSHPLATGGTQISGGKPGGSSGLGLYGKFGDGGTSQINHGGGGGGGYYGGGGGGVISSGVSSGAGGSSYISGYEGCFGIDAISTSSNLIVLSNSNHYSGTTFNNTSMIAGNAVMPSLATGTETGHGGNGLAIFTYLGN